jgi:hypothetical protein
LPSSTAKWLPRARQNGECRKNEMRSASGSPDNLLDGSVRGALRVTRQRSAKWRRRGKARKSKERQGRKGRQGEEPEAGHRHRPLQGPQEGQEGPQEEIAEERADNPSVESRSQAAVRFACGRLSCALLACETLRQSDLFGRRHPRLSNRPSSNRVFGLELVERYSVSSRKRSQSGSQVGRWLDAIAALHRAAFLRTKKRPPLGRTAWTLLKARAVSRRTRPFAGPAPPRR